MARTLLLWLAAAAQLAGADEPARRSAETGTAGQLEVGAVARANAPRGAALAPELAAAESSAARTRPPRTAAAAPTSPTSTGEHVLGPSVDQNNAAHARLAADPLRRLQGGAGSAACPAPAPASLPGSATHRQLNFTAAYDTSGTCSWVVTCSKSKAVFLRFASFSSMYGTGANAGYSDALFLYDGPDEAAPALGTLCGTATPAAFVAESGSMAMVWQYQYTSTTPSFEVDYWCAPASEIARGCTDPKASNYDAAATADDGSCYDHERQALLDAFKLAPTSRALDGWSATADVCTCSAAIWEGVTCTSDKRVLNISLRQQPDVIFTLGEELNQLTSFVYLSLWESGLRGTMPRALGTMPALQTLDLDTTALSGTIPPMTAHGMTQLVLYQTALSGSIPPSVSGLTGLTRLELSRTQISGSLPEDISGLSSLALLHVQDSALTGSLPDALGDLGGLQCLSLSNTGIDGFIPSTVENMASLYSLDIVGTAISGTLMVELSRIPNLQAFPLPSFTCTESCCRPPAMGPSLDLGGGTGISGTLIDSLGDMKALDTLGVGNTLLSGTLAPSMGEMTALRQFSASATRVSGTIVKELSHLTQLERLQIYAAPLSGTISTAMRSLTAIKIIDLPDTRISGTIPPDMGRLTALEELSLYNSSLSGTLPSELGQLGNLTNLYLDNTRLRGAIPDLSGCTALEVLILTGNSFTALPVAIPRSVTHLYLDENPLNSTAEDLAKLTHGLETLRTLSVSVSNLPIILESSAEYPNWRCNIGDRCRGTWVKQPTGCKVGQPCSWLLKLRDADDESARTGGLLTGLNIANCGDNTSLWDCAQSASMIDNRDGTFTATVPLGWVQRKGLHSFRFFHKGSEFHPSVSDQNKGTAYDVLRSTMFRALDCQPDSHTMPNEDGNTCECELGFTPVLPRNISELSCTRDCPQTGTRPSQDGNACECSDRFYDPTSAGRVACVLGDWPPAPHAAVTGDERCLPCPDQCANCSEGAIWAKPGWRLNGTVGDQDLSDQLGMPLQRRQQTLYFCPSGPEALCPAFPLDDKTQHDFNTSCALGRVGPLCQSCGPDHLVDKKTDECKLCPTADIEIISACSGAAFGALLLLVGLLLLVSWTREDTKVAEEGVNTLRKSLSHILSSQTSANQTPTSGLGQQLLPLPVAGSSVLEEDLTSWRLDGELERQRASSPEKQLSREPSIGTPEILETQAEIDKNREAALWTVSLQLAFQSARILISYVQVVSQLGDVLHVQLPPLFVEWLATLRFLTVDLSAFLSQCMMPCLSVYKLWMIYVVAVPAVMAGLVALLYAVDLKREVKDAGDKFKIRGYFVLFLVYPTVCRRSFSLFNCRHLGADFSVLMQDFDISCQGERHTFYQWGAGVVIIVFIVGVPAVLFVQLFRTLATKEETQQDQYIISNLTREGVELLGQFSKETAKDILLTTKAGQSAAFATSFKSRFYYWESLDMVRKLVLVGMIVFAGQGSTAQCCLAVLLSFLFFAAQVGFWPCKLDADNQLRTTSEAHIFLTCVIALALKTPLIGEKWKPDDYGAVLVITLVMLFLHAFYCVFVKIAEARRLLVPQDSEQSDADGTDKRRAAALENALKMYNLGFGDTRGTLALCVARLSVKCEEQKIAEQLSDADKRTLAWAKEDLALDSTSDAAIMQDACRDINLTYEPADPPPATVRAISDAIVGRAKRDEQSGVFMSHFQANAGPDVMELKGELERTHPELVEIWYDKDNNPSIEGMRLGVKKNKYFIAYLTKEYLTRPFCRKEIRWALMYQKKIILLWKREGKGSVGRFQDFFDECSQDVWIIDAMDGGGSDLKAIFGDAAINFYTDGAFQAASMAELGRRLDFDSGAVERRLYQFDKHPPRVLMAFNKADGQSQVRYITRELGRMAPDLDGTFGLLDVEVGSLLTVPDVIGLKTGQTVRKKMQSLVKGSDEVYFPPVLISYATGSRANQDADGCWPGMLYAQKVSEILEGHGIETYSGLHVHAGIDWKVFLEKMSSDFSECKVLIVIVTPALFNSQACMLEIFTALEANLRIIPVLFENAKPGEPNALFDIEHQWPMITGMSTQDVKKKLARVRTGFGSLNTIPAPPGDARESPETMDRVVEDVLNCLGRSSQAVDDYASDAITPRGRASSLLPRSASSSKDSYVIVYLTENIWTKDDTSMLDALVTALQVGATVLLVAETDMAHGWSLFMASHENTDWSDAVSHLKNNLPAPYFEARGGLQSSMFDDTQTTTGVIPFYKDKAFREVSLQIVLERLGAQATGEVVDVSVDVGSRNRSQSSGGTLTRTGTAPASLGLSGGTSRPVSPSKSVGFSRAVSPDPRTSQYSPEPEPEPEPGR